MKKKKKNRRLCKNIACYIYSLNWIFINFWFFKILCKGGFVVTSQTVPRTKKKKFIFNLQRLERDRIPRAKLN